MDNLIGFFKSNSFVISSNADVPGCDGRAVIIARKKKHNLELINIVELDESKIGGVQVGLRIPWLEQEYLLYVKWLSDKYGFVDEETTILGKDLRDAYRVSLFHNYTSENQGIISISEDDTVQWLVEKNESFYEDEKQTLKCFYCPSYWKNLPSYDINDRFLFESFIVINKLGIDFTDELLLNLVERTEHGKNINQLFLNNLSLFNQYLHEITSPIESKFAEFIGLIKKRN